MTPRILVVDDDEAILESLQIRLELEGYLVATTTQGAMVEQTATQLPASLIILDILLSGSDGRAIAARLKHYPATKHIPLVMLSAHPSAREGALAAGADAFIAKPFEAQELLQTIAQLLKIRRLI